MQTHSKPGARHLIALGFSELEADVYVFLLRESPATGYRVAQAIGRTAANTYKALESLEARGAVHVEEAESRLCRPVAPEELLRAMEVTFARHRDKAAKALREVSPRAADDGVYRIKTASQVFEMCRTVLQNAERVALLDAFAAPLERLREPMSEAVARGVRIAVLTYEPFHLPGVTVVVNHEATTVRARWTGQWLNLTADSSQQVNALLSDDLDDVVHATWTGSRFLTHLYHSGLLGELVASSVQRAFRTGASSQEIEQMLRSLKQFEHLDTPAYNTLRQEPVRRGRPRTGAPKRGGDGQAAPR
ncbi:MAG: TrmB family transcriptional regulator [Gemmatimonadaceae bacterium]|nr:TrmB family transcriptional regulator [Gemmatimonadaceae bacterium]